MKHWEKPDLRRILHILIAICIVGIACSALVLFHSSREYAEGDKAYRQVRRTVLPESAQEGKREDANIDFAALKEINPDVTAWLAAGDGRIDYPVVRGKDNDYYLSHLFNGERNKLGAIFMDCRSSGDFSDRNTIIYGHKMKDGSMFASLSNYKDQAYYDGHPDMMLYTPGGNYKIELFAGTVTDGSYESVRFNFKDDADFLNYIDSLKESSTFRSGTEVTAGDRIITLCTCSYEFDNARYALFGKLTPASR